MTQQKKQRVNQQTMMLVLFPVAAILSAVLFYVLGGGRPEQIEGVKSAGINTQLPQAQLAKEQPADKMAYYDMARQDSVHNDTAGLSTAAENLGLNPRENAQTQKINEKLTAINQALATPDVIPQRYTPNNLAGNTPTPITKDVDRLETLMKNMQQNGNDDPEMAQLGSMMDKLLALQNPELAKTLFKKSDNGKPDSTFAAIPAIIATSQKAKQGSVVELRLQDTLIINGQIIPKGHLIYGHASFSNQRLNLEIKNIRLGTSIIPVNITVFDQRDGMAGINAPEAMLNDAVKGGITDATGSIGITGFDLTTQIAGAGIDAAKNLLTKKVSKVKQSLKEGYRLLLRDNTKKNSLNNH
ncbi:conjugative transposon protein TraM [Pedobacter antarcticus]|uniref:conjugative transposon protein TraM n=1 Tax=Pedobacter antarcticus TaxID=34086 RepID=UPI0008894816|nr:conjugative transposon protein TraM [Pedobacter antarcticus]SDL84945.1 Bacteroides conjugative transposon TraM protein [Pedobacter antarcticus]